MRRAIEAEVSDSDRAIAELTLKRDKLLVESENIRRNEEYVKILMGNDPKAKEAKRRELERERDVATSELEELEHIIAQDSASDGANPQTDSQSVQPDSLPSE